MLITDVQPDTPAAKAGLKPGDVIVEFAGKPVASPQELQGVVERAKIGGEQATVVLRDGKRVTLNVTLREQPEDVAAGGNAPRR